VEGLQASELLSGLAADLAPLSDGHSVLRAAADRLVRGTHDAVDWCIADLLSGPDLVTRVATVSRHGRLELPDELGSADARRSSARSAGGLLAALAAAPTPVLRFDTDQLRALTLSEDPRTRNQARLTLSLGATDLLILGLRARTTLLGVLIVARTDGRFSEADLVALDGATAITTMAMDNARLLGNQRSLSAAMQTSLLPPLPSYPGVTLAARYHPAMTGLDVGGDWYDAFALPAGGLALVIGDVTGHDAHAAAQMSELRNLLRAIAYHQGFSPASTLSALEETTTRLRVEAGATCLLATVDPSAAGARRLRWSSAGHLPPLLLRDGDARFLDTAADLMLGVWPGSTRTEHSTDLLAGDVLVLYSDGLVEDRRSHLDERLALLGRTALAAPHTLPDYLADWLLRGMAASGTDDVALLVARIDA
jgi:sigma-B regulation protein RsbU (phosphoserine phosphatase)